MNNRERYRAAFGHIRAPEGAAARAEQALKEGAAPKRRRRGLRTVLIAAAAFALLVGAAGAELSTGAVSNLLAPLYGAARTELVDAVGCPVGASVSANGYTLTAEAVVGDRHNVAVVYTFTRDDGQPIPEGAHFDLWDSNALDLPLFGGSGGGGVLTEPDETQANRLNVVEHWQSSSVLLWRGFEMNAHNLVVLDEETLEYRTIAEGDWSLSFTLRYADSTVELPVSGVTVTGTEGNEYQLQRLELSAVGVHMDLLAPNDPSLGPDNPPGPGWPLPDFEGNYLRMFDGTTVDLDKNYMMGGGGSLDAPAIKADYGVFFDQPIDLSQVEAVVICGTEIPVALS